jgi:APA family basic amino acid/polyamine antiporter
MLGAGFGIAVGVGTTIGSGILRTPGEVAGQLGSAPLVLVVWVLGGVYALLGCSSVTELGTMLPNSGGFYAYAARAFGVRTGFVVGCLNVMVEAVALAYLSTAMGEFAGGLFPVLAGHVQLVGVSGLLLLGLLNWLGLRPGSRAQEITSVAKAVGLIALVIGCFVVHPSASGPAAPPIASGHGTGLFFGLIIALQGVIVTYDGWYAPIYFAEEDQNPSRNMPRAMLGTVLCCTAIYVLMNVAMLHALGLKNMSGAKMPAADAALLVFGSHGQQFILLISLITVLSTINAGLMLTPRILFSMARDGLLPQSLTEVNAGGTPAVALLICTLAGVALVLSGSFETLVAVASILFVANYLPVFAALLVIRKREPDLPRPYKVWLYPWTTVLVLLVSIAFLVGSVIGDLTHSLFTVIVILLSYVAAVVITRRRAKVPV